MTIENEAVFDFNFIRQIGSEVHLCYNKAVVQTRSIRYKAGYYINLVFIKNILINYKLINCYS